MDVIPVSAFFSPPSCRHLLWLQGKVFCVVFVLLLSFTSPGPVLVLGP